MMPLTEYAKKEFDAADITCQHCHWKGKGAAAIVIDFYGVSDSSEVHCPDCDAKLSSIKKEKGSPPGESTSD